MTDCFAILIRVRYAECDSQKIVFNARYGDYVDLAVTEYYRQAIGGYDQMLEQGMDAQVVSLKTDWSSPARFEDVLRISVEPLRFGNTSYTLRMTFTDHATDRLVAVSEITNVMVKPVTHEKMAIPQHFRDAMQRPASKVVNLAGI